MANLLNIGLSGLKAHQTALATTGNNVANTDTPGYSRQEVIFDSSKSQLTGAGYVGSGVNITTIRRINEEFLNTQLRADTTVFNEREALLNLSSQIDDLLGSETTGLSSAMSTYFEALQGAANDPSSVPERQLVLSQSESLVSRFHAIYSRLQQQSELINQNMSAEVSTINSLASGVAELNEAITIATGAAGQGDQPNTLLDQRDELLRQLSEKVTVSVIPQSDGQVNVFIGKGQPLVINNESSELRVVESADDPTSKDIAFVNNGREQVITSDITGGALGGVLDYRDSIHKASTNSMGLIAITLADTVNEQHQLGMDLNNNLGGFFFTDINDDQLQSARSIGNANNLPPMDRVVKVEIVDSGQLTIDDYELQFGGPSASDYRVVNNTSGDVVTQGVLPGFFPASIEVDGFSINLEGGTFQVGDKFLIQPTRFGSRDFGLNVDEVEEIAFAAPIRSDASLGNIGSGVISQGTMSDVTNPLTNQPLSTFSVPGQLTPPMVVRFTSDTLYDILDATDPSNLVPLNPPMNNQAYVPGLSNELFTEDPGQTIVSSTGASMGVLPPAAASGTFNNGYLPQNITVFSRDLETGVVSSQIVGVALNDSADVIAANLSSVQGVSANAYSQATVDNIDPTDAMTLNGEPLIVNPPAIYSADELANVINNNGNLSALGIYAVSDGNTLTVKSSLGVDLQFEATAGDIDVSKVNPYTGATVGPQTLDAAIPGQVAMAVGGYLDVTMAEGVTLFADADTVFQQAPPAQSSYKGFQMNIKGEPQAGDLFDIGYNTGGTSDNRNALAMVQLETTGTVGGGVSTYNEAYSQVVEKVGTFTNQARLDTEASKTLLGQTTASWNEVSGVNLDEEAGRLIQYQSAYNASAQVISVARELFDTLLAVF